MSELEKLKEENIALASEREQLQHDYNQLKEAYDAKVTGVPIGPIVGAQTIVNQQRQINKLEQKLADAQARVKDLEQEQAAIKQAVSREFAKKSYTDEDRKHEDLLENIGVFLNHHQELEQQHAALRERVMQEAIKVMCPYCNDPAWSNSRAVFSGEVAHISPMTGTRFLCAASKLHQYLAKHALATGAEGPK